MKNIHLIKTDKASRLYKQFNNLYLENEIPRSQVSLEERKLIPQHIYVTNNEEIKEGDWYYDFNLNEIKKALEVESDRIYYTRYHCTISTKAKKIILTTDQDLVKNGVQAIDDEFLEWFVENPSCEEVDVKKGSYNLSPMEKMLEEEEYVPKDTFNTYKITIPKEKPKDFLSRTETDLLKQEAIEQEMEEFDKQETLEEVCNKINFVNPRERVAYYNGLKNGAKWQSERMYSEEEVKQAYLDGCKINLTNTHHLNKWFEQFKKN